MKYGVSYVIQVHGSIPRVMAKKRLKQLSGIDLSEFDNLPRRGKLRRNIQEDDEEE